MKKVNWRDEMQAIPHYKKKFAILPIECSDGTKVWFKFYYSKYQTWNSPHSSKVFDIDAEYGHTEFVENVNEAEYIVRRLVEGL
jgi:hypothetical protein